MQPQGSTYIEPTGDNINLGDCFVGRTLVRQLYSGLLTKWAKKHLQLALFRKQLNFI
jgi:hypothetical protein